MPSTAAAIRDRITALISALSPTTDERTTFRSSRNVGRADFLSDMESAPAGALRRFQIRDDGTEEPPEVTNTDVDLRHVTFEIRVAYPQNQRFGKDAALDRDDVIAQDWAKLNRAVGIYGRANFTGAYDCTPLGATREIEIGESVDFLIVRARFSFYFTVYTAPVASFTHSANGFSVTFADTSTDADGSIRSWLWNFGDSQTSTLQNPTHTYNTDGTFTVTLTVTDDQGITASVASDVENTAVLAGWKYWQSNQNGRGTVASLSAPNAFYANNYTDVDTYVLSGGSVTAPPQVWTDYGERPLGQWFSGFIGSEVSQYRELDADIAGRWVSIKTAIDGSSMFLTWRPGAVNSVFAEAVAYVNESLAAEGAQLAFLDGQGGEQDADYAQASDHIDHITEFHDAAIAEFGLIPHILGLLHVDCTQTNTATVRAHSKRFAAITPYVTLVDNDDLTLMDEGGNFLHYDADSLVEIGIRKAAAYVATQTQTTLTVAIAESADPVDAGAEYSYTVVVTNTGASNAVNVGASVVLPAGASFVSATGSGWTQLEIVSGRLIMTRSTLAPGAAPTITVTVDAGSAGAAVATAQAVASNVLAAATDSESTTIVSSGTAPSLRAAGTLASGTGAVTPANPTHQTGDCLVLQVAVYTNGSDPGTPATPAGWTLQSSKTSDFSSARVRHAVFTKVAASGAETNPTITDNHDICAAIVYSVQGVNAVPVDVVGTAWANDTYDSTVAVAGATAGGTNRFVLSLFGGYAVGLTTFSGSANADLSSVTEVIDTMGDGLHLGCISGVRAASGAFGATTATHSGSCVTAGVSIAFKP